jgi:hypothetical protein
MVQRKIATNTKTMDGAHVLCPSATMEKFLPAKSGQLEFNLTFQNIIVVFVVVQVPKHWRIVSECVQLSAGFRTRPAQTDWAYDF